MSARVPHIRGLFRPSLVSVRMESGRELYRKEQYHLLDGISQSSSKYRFERPTWKPPNKQRIDRQLYVQAVSRFRVKGISRSRWILARYRDDYWDTPAPIDGLEVIEECDHYMYKDVLKNRFDFFEHSQRGIAIKCANVCLIGPVRAKIPDFKRMAKYSPKALVDVQEFKRPSDSQGYSEREQDVFMLAGYDAINRKFVELKHLTAYPAADRLSGHNPLPGLPCK